MGGQRWGSESEDGPSLASPSAMWPAARCRQEDTSHPWGRGQTWLLGPHEKSLSCHLLCVISRNALQALCLLLPVHSLCEHHSRTCSASGPGPDPGNPGDQAGCGALVFWEGLGTWMPCALLPIAGPI